MELAQRLYEQGVISYMRTDSPNLSDVICDEIEVYAKAKNLPLAEKRRKWKAKAGAQEAHEAVRPARRRARRRRNRRRTRLVPPDLAANGRLVTDATFAVRTATLEHRADGRLDPRLIARGRTHRQGLESARDEPEEDGDDDEDAAQAVPVLAIGGTPTVDRGKCSPRP
jgi:DNA topoisomerase-1